MASRVSPDSDSQSLVGNADPPVKQQHSQIKVVLVVGLWFTCAVTLSNALKWLFKTLSWKYPITVTFGHMIFSNLAAFLYMTVYGGKVPTYATRKRVWFLACAFITSVAMTNIGIKHVYVSFAMTVGATSPMFTVLMSKIIMKKQYNRWVYISIIPMVVGIYMASKGEMDFDTIGFICCTIGVIFRAVKSVIQQMLLTDPTEKLNPIELLFYMSQPCILITGVWAYFGESADVIADKYTYRTQTWVMYLVTCILAIGMNITTFLVTFLTSAVTLQVLGQGKVVMTILLSLVLFKNQISLLGGVGCCTTIAGAMMYARVKSWPIDS